MKKIEFKPRMNTDKHGWGKRTWAHLRLVPLVVLVLTSAATGQEFHAVTNVVQVPCQKIYYYGLLEDGGKIERTVLDHDCEQFERNLTNWQRSIVFILRSSTPLNGTVLWYDANRLKAVGGVDITRHEGSAARLSAGGGPRPLKSPVAMPPLPPMPSDLNRQSFRQRMGTDAKSLSETLSQTSSAPAVALSPLFTKPLPQ